jgi:hypothetical protein
VPPTVTVTAAYPGASAETVAETVAAPIEQEINGVDNMLYMSSQSTGDGTVTITVTFKIGTNLDAAQVLVQNRVAVAVPRLPEEVQRLGVVTRKTSPDFLMVVNLVSPDKSLDRGYISNYALTQVRDRLSRIDGVGDVRLFGARLCDARLDRSRPRRRAQPDRGRDRRGAARAERPGRRRHARPAGSRQRPRLPAQRRDAGPPEDPEQFANRSSSAPMPTAARSASPTSPGRARRRRLRLQHLSLGPADRDPAGIFQRPGLERARRGQGRQGRDGHDVAKLLPQGAGI